MGCCEDGVCVDIEPQSYTGVLLRNPDSHQGLPYWERPQFLPVAFVEEFVGAFLSNMTTGQKQTLAAMLAPYL